MPIPGARGFHLQQTRRDPVMDIAIIASLATALVAAAAPDAAIAQAFRPRIHFNNAQRCWPLTYQEISPTASTSDRDGMKKRCNKSYNENFIMFASVKRPSSGAPGPKFAASTRTI